MDEYTAISILVALPGLRTHPYLFPCPVPERECRSNWTTNPWSPSHKICRTVSAQSALPDCRDDLGREYPMTH